MSWLESESGPLPVVDFDVEQPGDHYPGTVDAFVLTVSSPIDETLLGEAFATLRSDGVAQLRVASSSPPLGSVLVASLPGEWRDRSWSWAGHDVRLEVCAGTGPSDFDDDAEMLRCVFAVVAELRELPATVDMLRKRADRVEREANRRLERVHDTTRYRLGAAMVDLVRSPCRAPAVFRELRSIWKRRSAPPAATTPSSWAEARLDVKVGSILDEFSHDCFAPEVELVPLNRTDGVTQLDGLDLVLVESAWRGNAGHWNYAINRFEPENGPLATLLDAARTRRIPTVFWNKEDPVGYDQFLPAARAFDYVVTTDTHMVARYRAELGHQQVETMAFAAQPQLHNPTGRPRGHEVEPRLCFAGSWRGNKYDRRRADFDALLLPPIERGVLDIYDRYADGNEADRFPLPYRDAVVGSLPYLELMSAYRRYAGFLNVNSVSDSPSMFSRRVFELLACGTPVISTPAQGIETMLGDTVLVSDTQHRTRTLVDWLLNEPDARERHAHRGYRWVHGKHSYEHRVDELLGRVGKPPTRPRRRVSVVCSSNRPENLAAVIEHYNTQTHPDRELIFVANSAAFRAVHFAMLEREVEHVRVLHIDESESLGHCLNAALEVATGDYVAKFDDDDLYGPEYLADLLLAFGYSGAAVVGKQSYYAYLGGSDETVVRFPGREFCEAPRVVGGTLLIDRAKVEGISFAEIHGSGTDSHFLEAVRNRGLIVYSADRYNFCQVRQPDTAAHTWKIDDEEFLSSSRRIGRGLQRDEVFV